MIFYSQLFTPQGSNVNNVTNEGKVGKSEVGRNFPRPSFPPPSLGEPTRTWQNQNTMEILI